jgi:phosphoribosylformylglycinamidine synthase
VPIEEPGMSPAEIWCNEAQERYVLAIAPEAASPNSRPCASASAARSPWSAKRPATASDGADRHFGNNPVDMDMDALLGKPPRMTRDVTHLPAASCPSTPPRSN